MPLIDYTFFQGGELNIPNTDKSEVLEELNRFIVKYEDKFLTDVLGYELYKAFKAGLAEDTLAQRWTDLLTGKEYTYGGRTVKWVGLLEGGVIGGSSLSGYRYKEPVLIEVGVTPGFTAGGNTLTLNGDGAVPDWAGWKIIPERLGFGTQKEGIDYTYNKTTGKWDLLPTGATFDQGDFYFVQFIPNADQTIVVEKTNKSVIANYVYYWFQRNSVTQSTGNGETSSKVENAVKVNPAVKMARAWNEADDIVKELRQYLNVNAQTYPEWDSGSVSCSELGYMNPMF